MVFNFVSEVVLSYIIRTVYKSEHYHQGKLKYGDLKVLVLSRYQSLLQTMTTFLQI